jgi:sulfur carrier protein
MNIILNGEKREVAATNVDALLRECGFGPAVATAHNGDFVPVARRAETAVGDGDQIEVVAPMQGG